MAQSGWLDQNRNRTFPFLLRQAGLPVTGPLTLANLPHAVIVDVGFIMGSKSRFDAGEHNVYLTRITRLGDNFEFEFTSDAPQLSGAPLLFTRALSDENNLTEFGDTGAEGLSQSGSESDEIEPSACEEPLWSGYMVSGTMTALDAFLVGNGDVVGAVQIEPALIQNLAGGYVNSINLGNDDRTRVTASDEGDCDDVVWPYTTGIVFVAAQCLVGDLVFQAGYNAIVRQSDHDNSITLGAAVGEGEGEPCDEVTLFPGEVPPEDSNLLAGGPQCNEVLRSINGIGGRLFNIIAGQGVTVTSVPDEHKLVIDVNMTGLALCFTQISAVSESV